MHQQTAVTAWAVTWGWLDAHSAEVFQMAAFTHSPLAPQAQLVV
jgi:hypothetical protein